MTNPKGSGFSAPGSDQASNVAGKPGPAVVVSVSVTEAGRRLAGRLPYETVHRGAADAVRSLWGTVDGLVLFLATGAAVRILAPLLTDGGHAPAVVSVDEAGRYVVVLVGGHRSGANALAVEVAALIGATPVVTTATDAARVAALDELPGFTVHGDVAGFSRARLDGMAVSVEDHMGWPLPPALLETAWQDVAPGSPIGAEAARPSKRSAAAGQFDGTVGAAQFDGTTAAAQLDGTTAAGRLGGAAPAASPPTLVVDDRSCPGCPAPRDCSPALDVPTSPTSSDVSTPPDVATFPNCSAPPECSVPGELSTARCPSRVIAHPPSLVVGVGCTTGATTDDVADAISLAITQAGLALGSVAELATIDRRRDHEAIAAMHLPVRFFTAEQLAEVAVPHPSQAVLQAVGTPSVAEAAALLAAGEGAVLVTGKCATATATAAIARRSRPRACLTLVGLGPGDPSLRSPAATAAVRHADVVIGYRAYIDQCAALLRPHQEVIRSPIGAELERARQALDLAASGRFVAMVCSGDAGIFAMASPVLELAGDPAYRHVEVVGVPGVTAAHAAAALLGAPLGHDHAVLSLSDLLTPWSVIEQRIVAVAAGDLAVAFYNPRSARRNWQLERARQILLSRRPPTTPVGIVTDAGRPGEQVILATLGDFDSRSVSMTSCVVVGSSTTVVAGGRMVTPRGYPRGATECST